jgi:class 3 adenylate cyclase/TolB-like protein
MTAEPSPTSSRARDENVGTLLRTLVLCDLVDSTTLVERLGDKTAADLLRQHDRLVRVALQRHTGREIDKTDGFLLLFARPIEAVAFALEYERGLRALAEEAKQPLVARVGIHVGEVVVWENIATDVAQGAKPMEVEGLAKPVAARLMGLALPGQILLSAMAQTLAQRAERELDPRAGGLRWLAHGRYHFKGVPEPVTVYEVGEPGIAPLRAPPDSPKAWRTKAWWRRPVPVAVATLAVLVAVAVPLYITQPWKATSAPIPLRLAVAVLPFTALDGDPAEQTAADELTLYLTSVIGWMRMTKVVSRDLAASYKGRPIDPRSVGRALDASYLVQGQLRRVDGRIEVDAQLMDASSATQLWSERLEIAQARERLPGRIVEGIKTANMRRFAGPPPPNASALELTWHAYSAWNNDNNTLRGVLEAQKWFNEALRLDPNFLPAIGGQVTALESELNLNPEADHSRILREMDELSFRAVSIDSSDSISWQNRTATLMRLQRWEAALEASDKSAGFQPVNAGWVAIHRAGIMLMLGRPQDALALANGEIAANPQNQNQEERGRAMLQRCRACMALGRYDEAIAACERGVALDDWWLPHLYLIAGYALEGDTGKAAAEKAALHPLRPNASIADFKKLYWSDNAAFVQQTETHLLAGLRKAGFPEE